MKVYVFITCLVDNFFPEVGENMLKVLHKLGLEVDCLEGQTCCGQPAFNSGYQDDARAVAERFITLFKQVIEDTSSNDSHIVCPSGSCATMVKVFYKELFKTNPNLLEIVERLSSNTYEFSEFLVKVLKTTQVGAAYNGIVTYHDSCHALRELGIKSEPRRLIESVEGAKFVEMGLHDACCGFGGTFSIKFPKVSVSMLEEKIDCIIESGADTVVSSDVGCLMNMGGAITRRNVPIKVMHIADLLASTGGG